MVHVFEEDFWNEYEKPVVEKPTLKQAVQALLGRAKQLLPSVHPTPDPVVRRSGPKGYQKPTLRKLSPQQASLILIGHAGVGDEAAKELLDIVYKMNRGKKNVGELNSER